MLHGVFLSFIECYNYKVLNEPSRSKTYYRGYNNQCDNTLSIDWYRFSGAAGNQISQSCVDRYRCGTSRPGWLSGSHPTVNEGVVQRRVCFGSHRHCCIYSTYIRVRNCGGFYVYQLKPLPGCYLRYCGNGYGSSTPTTTGTLFLLSSLFFFHPAKNALRVYRWKKIKDTVTLLTLKYWFSVLKTLSQPKIFNLHPLKESST